LIYFLFDHFAVVEFLKVQVLPLGDDCFAKIIHTRLAINYKLIENFEQYYQHETNSALENDNYELY
jgi:hypothetical protein